MVAAGRVPASGAAARPAPETTNSMDSTRPGRLPGSGHGGGPRQLLDVRPGDEAAVDTIERWFLNYQVTGDPAVPEASWRARRWSR